MITIIDYDAGNLRSVENALQFLGEEAKITRDPQEILKADKVILPGVGAFGDAMEKLHKYNLVSVIREVNEKQIPFLGICLGLQLLFEESDETPGVKGLGVLPGKIKGNSAEKKASRFHIWGGILFRSKREQDCFRGSHRMHMYILFIPIIYRLQEREDVAATTEYIVPIHASVESGNTFACQFHPEKSGDIGLQILKNFATFNRMERR